MSLEEASLAKLERICDKLELGPDDHVLEIGTGWGGFARPRRRDARLPRDDDDDLARAARARASAACARPGSRTASTVLLEDYRDLRRQLRQARLDRDDRGRRLEGLRHVLRQCSQLLEPDGAMLLQAITIDDRAYEVEKAREVVHPHAHLPQRLPAVARGDRALRGARDRHADRPPRGHHAALRRDAAALARPFDAARAGARRSSATTSASGGCGRCTWPTARRASPSAGSATCSCCSPSRAGGHLSAGRASRAPRWTWRAREPRDRRQGVATRRAPRSDGDRQLHEPRLRAAQPALGWIATLPRWTARWCS